MAASYSCNTNSRKASAMAPACTSASSFCVILGSTVVAVLIFIALACLIAGALPLAVLISLAVLALLRGKNNSEIRDAEI